MGQHLNSNLLRYNTHLTSLTKNRFEYIYIIGKGGFGKVWKVKDKKTNRIYALKEMKKSKVIQKQSVKSVLYEKTLLSNLTHSFIVNMHFSFQDKDNLYLIMDYLSGGDLRYNLSHYKKQFSEKQAQFFIACIILALEYIHNKGIIHRDIKPENLVFDNIGYLRVTDFGIARMNVNNNSAETSGTPGYMAPEVIRGLHHTYTVDYFALGVIAYEIMLGKVREL